MTVARVALTELKRLTSGKLPKIVLALMCIIPLLYSSIYLYGSWDPYNKMDDVKGALVMLDAGATKDDGTQMNSGQDIKDELLEKNNFDWETVDTKDDAVNGVTDGTYDFALVIDADFSKNLLSSGAFKPDENGNTGTIDPQQAGLEIITNDANNYVLTNIVKNAGTTIRDNVASQVGDETANELLASFTTIHNKMAEASDGASQLADGTGELSDGTNTLKEGTVKLSDGTVTLADGTQTLLDGANQLVDGQQQLADGADQLDSGASDLASGAASAHDGAQQLSSGADTLATGAASADEGAKQLADGAGTLNEKMGEAAVGAGDLASGASTLNDGVTTLKNGTQQLADGASALADGTTTLSDGADQVSDGASSLSEGATKLADGTSELNSTVQNSGLTNLASGLEQVCKDLSQTNTSEASGDFGTDLSNTVVSDIADKTKENLAPLVAAGTLTQEQADQIVAQISSDKTKSTVATHSEDALKRLREGALSGSDGSAAADLAAMSSQLDALKSSSCATTGESSVADQLNTLVSAISSVNDGAQQLNTGASSLKDGAASVASGAQTVEENTAKLSDGASSVNSGVDSLKAGTEALVTGANTLASGATQLADGTQTLADGSSTLAEGTGELADGSSTLADGSKTLADGTSQLADGSNTLADGADTLASGEATALDGQKSLADGANQVNDGASDLESGASDLDSGAGDLQSGASQVDDGANELSDGIADGTKQVPNLSTDDQNKVASNMSDPVNLDHISLANGSNYGEGMGPYFMVLSLWIGMLMLVQTLRPMNARALASNAPSLRVILGSWAPFALIGIVQAMLVYAIVAGALGFNFVHPVMAFFFLCFVSLVYSAIIHGLVIFLGSPGKAVALVLLIIQLVTSGGTMPYETLPSSIRWLHNILPMGYALSGVRRIAYGIDLGGIWPQISVLLIWFAIGLSLGLIGTIRNRVWNLKALNPEIIV